MGEIREREKYSMAKSFPKDGQVIMAMMYEMGVVEFDPKVIMLLIEFVYKYATNILEEARMYANYSEKKLLQAEHIRLAMLLMTESAFQAPPPREILLAYANGKNYIPLPLVKHHSGLRLPPDRYCLSACNYALKSSNSKKKMLNDSSFSVSPPPPLKIAKPNLNFIKRAQTALSKHALAVGKPMAKYTGVCNISSKPICMKPKIQISNSITFNGTLEIDHGLKRKREDDDM